MTTKRATIERHRGEIRITFKTCPACGGAGSLPTGSALRKLRLRAGLLQKDIATAMGISQSYLYDLEADRRQWNHDLLTRWFAAFPAAEQAADDERAEQASREAWLSQ